MKIKSRSHFYKFKKVKEITFLNSAGMSVSFSTFGAAIYEIQAPDRDGVKEVITLTPEKKRDFYHSGQFYGKTIGRTAGRIKNGEIMIDDVKYKLSANRNGITLHGGWNSMSFKVFSYRIIRKKEFSKIVFMHESPEGNNGYPGKLTLEVTYTVYEDENRIDIEFDAATSDKTILNITNHIYFNLSGNMKRSILDHELKIAANEYATLDESLNIKEVVPVNEVMDFQKGKRIGQDIMAPSLVDSETRGYDHTFIKNKPDEESVAELYDPQSGREVVIASTYPCIVLYTMNYPGHNTLKRRVVELKWSGVALECEYLANDFKSMIITPAQRYHHRITYKFGIRNPVYIKK